MREIEEILDRLEPDSNTRAAPSEGKQVSVIDTSLPCRTSELTSESHTAEVEGLLAQLRAFTATSQQLGALFTKRALSILCFYGFDDASPATTRRLALRCLCNVLLLSVPTRQIFVDENCPKKAIELLKSDHPDDELLAARQLLLCTYGTSLDFNTLITTGGIAEALNSRISYHAARISATEEKTSSPDTNIAVLNESLKLFCNLAAQYPQHSQAFLRSLSPIFSILNTISIPAPPLEPPVSLLINCLVVLNISGQNTEFVRNSLFPESDNVCLDRLVHLLDVTTTSYGHEELNERGSPLVQLLLRIAEIAPFGPKAHLKSLLLPSEKDREGVLGTGDSLPARLLRLSTEISLNHLRLLIPSLLFELSDKDERQFSHNIGYGYASGLLLSLGKSLSPDDPKASASSEAATGSDINPVTGQKIEWEQEVNMPEMTDEEKEREAERLFVLFERLRATGVVDVDNPVARAARDGRFEEIE
ncbi:hypothetical protein LOZ58_001842 [Ophidiomyces ophidiicola]|nr:hypothetical protein LOZ58_001842 [Ophidiomyces ophidiicola]